MAKSDAPAQHALVRVRLQLSPVACPDLHRFLSQAPAGRISAILKGLAAFGALQRCARSPAVRERPWPQPRCASGERPMLPAQSDEPGRNGALRFRAWFTVHELEHPDLFGLLQSTDATTLGDLLIALANEALQPATAKAQGLAAAQAANQAMGDAPAAERAAPVAQDPVPLSQAIATADHADEAGAPVVLDFLNGFLAMGAPPANSDVRLPQRA